jgi:hypothetical protein
LASIRPKNTAIDPRLLDGQSQPLGEQNCNPSS